MELYQTLSQLLTPKHEPTPHPISLPPSSPSTQQASLQHENELNLILQLLSISYSLGRDRQCCSNPQVPFLIQTVHLSPVSRRLSSCSSLRLCLPFVFYSFCLKPFRCSVTRLAGILQCESSQVRDKTQIFRLFCHECQRVFHDRLINNQDKMYFNTIVCEMAGETAFPRFFTLMLYGFACFSAFD